MNNLLHFKKFILLATAVFMSSLGFSQGTADITYLYKAVGSNLILNPWFDKNDGLSTTITDWTVSSEGNKYWGWRQDKTFTYGSTAWIDRPGENTLSSNTMNLCVGQMKEVKFSFLSSNTGAYEMKVRLGGQLLGTFTNNGLLAQSKFTPAENVLVPSVWYNFWPKHLVFDDGEGYYINNNIWHDFTLLLIYEGANSGALTFEYNKTGLSRQVYIDNVEVHEIIWTPNPTSNEVYLPTCDGTYDLTTLNPTEDIPEYTYTWYHDSNHTTPVANPAAVKAGTYYLFASSSCTGTEYSYPSRQVEVNSAPNCCGSEIIKNGTFDGASVTGTDKHLTAYNAIPSWNASGGSSYNSHHVVTNSSNMNDNANLTGLSNVYAFYTASGLNGTLNQAVTLCQTNPYKLEFDLAFSRFGGTLQGTNVELGGVKLFDIVTKTPVPVTSFGLSNIHSGLSVTVDGTVPNGTTAQYMEDVVHHFVITINESVFKTISSNIIKFTWAPYNTWYLDNVSLKALPPLAENPTSTSGVTSCPSGTFNLKTVEPADGAARNHVYQWYNDANATNPIDDPTKVSEGTYYMQTISTCSYCVSTSTTKFTVTNNCPSYSGMVYADYDGLSSYGFSNQWGTGTDGGGLYAILTNSSGVVINSSEVDRFGNFDILGDGTGTQIILNNKDLPKGSKITTSTLNPNYFHTGDALGSSTPSGAADGISPSWTAGASQNAVYFGVNAAPISVGNTEGKCYDTKPASFEIPALYGYDDRESNEELKRGKVGEGDKLIIKKLSSEINGMTVPTSNGTLKYDGVAITAPLTIDSYDPAKLVFEPAANNDASRVVFEYAFVDMAGVESLTPAVVDYRLNVTPKINNYTVSVSKTGTFNYLPVNGVNGVVPAGTTYTWSAPAMPSNVTGGVAGANQTAVSGTLKYTGTTTATVVYNVTASSEVDGFICNSTFTITVNLDNLTPIEVVNDAGSTPWFDWFTQNIFGNDKNVTDMKSITYMGSNGSLVTIQKASIPTSSGNAITIYAKDASGAVKEAGKMFFTQKDTYQFRPVGSYNENRAFIGDVYFSYIGTNASGATGEGLVTISLLPEQVNSNNAPVAISDNDRLISGGTATTSPLLNDKDIDGNILSIIGAQAYNASGALINLTETLQDVYALQNGAWVKAGQASVNAADGKVTFTADVNFIGDVEVKYAITDGSLNDNASVYYIVEKSNSAPLLGLFADYDFNLGYIGQTLTGNLFSNDKSLNATSFKLDNLEGITDVIAGKITYENESTGGVLVVDVLTGDYTYTNPTSFTGSEFITYTIKDKNGITSSAGLILNIFGNNYWVGGKTANVWDNPGNWSRNIVPVGINRNIEFATATNNPKESGNLQSGPAVSDLHVPTGLDNAKIIGNLTNQTNKALVVPAGASLTINGSITGSDASNVNRLVVKAGTPDAATEDGKRNGTLIVANGCNKGIFGTVEFLAKGIETTAGTWNDNFPGSPDAKKDFTTKYKWQFFGIPVKSISAMPTFENAFIRQYNEAYNGKDNTHFYQKWQNVTGNDALTAFKGYEITHDKVDMHGKETKLYTMTGELNFCEQKLVMTRKAPEVTTSSAIGDAKHYGLGQNIFGNSYTSAIKISEMQFPEEVDATVYLYNTGRFHDWAQNFTSVITEVPSDNSLLAGQYLAIPQQVASTVWDNQIPSMQGFLLRFKPSETIFNGADATVTLPYSTTALTTNTKQQLVREESAANHENAFLRVNLQSKTTVDNLWLIDQPGASEKYENGWDGRKFFGTPTAFIYSETPDGPMQVNSNSTIDGSVISFFANGDTDYTLTLVKSNLDEYQELSLLDLATRKIIPLTTDTTRYSFQATTSGVADKRFIILNKAADKINLQNGDFEQLGGYITSENVLTAINYTGEAGTMKLYNTAGALLKSEKMTIGTNQYPTTLQSGVYLMKLDAGISHKTIRVIVK